MIKWYGNYNIDVLVLRSKIRHGFGPLQSTGSINFRLEKQK